MKIQIASDLHLESVTGHLPAPDAFRPVRDRDVLVLAGDIGTYALAREFVVSQLALSPVIYVPGNHEYYGFQMRADIDEAWRQLPALHYLAAQGVTIEGVRFWGAPWYSDLWGLTDHWRAWNTWKLPMFEKYILDFRYPYNSVNTWSLAKHLEAHLEQTAELRNQAGRVDVVATHWPPTKEAIHPKYEGDELNPYFTTVRLKFRKSGFFPLIRIGYRENRVSLT